MREGGFGESGKMWRQRGLAATISIWVHGLEGRAVRVVWDGMRGGGAFRVCKWGDGAWWSEGGGGERGGPGRRVLGGLLVGGMRARSVG